MSRRLTEWDCMNIANNLDRMEDYRSERGSNVYLGVGPKERLTEWDAQQIANNLDRIDSYRRGGIFEDAQLFAGLVAGIPMIIFIAVRVVIDLFGFIF